VGTASVGRVRKISRRQGITCKDEDVDNDGGSDNGIGAQPSGCRSHVRAAVTSIFWRVGKFGRCCSLKAALLFLLMGALRP